MMICFGYAPFVAFWGAHYGASDMGIPVIPGGGLDTKRRAFFIDEYKPTVLVCTPSYAIFLAETMKEVGYDPPASSVRALITAGEPGPCIPATKKRIEEMWDATLMEVMGCTEMAPVPMLYSCWSDAVDSKEEGRVHAPHLFEDMYLPESLDPETLEPVPDGERGMIVASNLFEESQPILRYTIGDYWTIDRKEMCSCGRTQARVPGGLKGRADDMLKFKGVVMFPSTIESVVREIPEVGEEFLVEIAAEKGMDTMVIKVEPAQGVEDSAENREGIQKKVIEAMKMKVGVSVRSECVPPNTLPRTEFKARRVVDNRSKEH
jgi:phenylacetate-CoA ligase